MLVLLFHGEFHCRIVELFVRHDNLFMFRIVFAQVITGSVEIPVAEVAMNSAIKYLDQQFSASLDFTKTDGFDSTSAPNDQSSVSALSNKYSPSVPANATPHADLPAINTFQTTQSSKQNLPSSNVSSVLNQNNKVGYFFHQVEKP